jgi:Holliday junction DNA helicase RuvA
MIAGLRGKLAEAELTSAVLDVGGVFYKALIPISTFDKLPRPGNEVFLHTLMRVSEDAVTLYGFATTEERQLFGMLTNVSGIGPKTALNILSGTTVQGFCAAIASADIKTLKKLNGVGPRTAERLALELRDKVASVSPSAAFAQAGPAAPSVKAASDAALALEQLGFKGDKVRKVTADIAASLPESERSVENILRKSLQALNN